MKNNIQQPVSYLLNIKLGIFADVENLTSFLDFWPLMNVIKLDWTFSES